MTSTITEEEEVMDRLEHHDCKGGEEHGCTTCASVQEQIEALVDGEIEQIQLENE